MTEPYCVLCIWIPSLAMLTLLLSPNLGFNDECVLLLRSTKYHCEQLEKIKT